MPCWDGEVEASSWAVVVVVAGGIGIDEGREPGVASIH